MKKRKLTTTLVASGLALTSVIGLGASAYAADSNGSSTKSKAPTAAEIKQHDNDRKDRMEERLTQAVKDSKITEEQKTLIIEFFENNKPSKPSETTTREERKDEMDAFKEKVDAFAKDNNIDVSLFAPRGHDGPHGSGGQGGHDGSSRADRPEHGTPPPGGQPMN